MLAGAASIALRCPGGFRPAALHFLQPFIAALPFPTCQAGALGHQAASLCPGIEFAQVCGDLCECRPQLEDGKLSLSFAYVELTGFDLQMCVDFSPVLWGLRIPATAHLLCAVASEGQSYPSFARQLLGASPLLCRQEIPLCESP